MKRLKIFVLFLIIGKILIAQPIHKVFNDYYSKYFSYPFISPEFFIDGPIHGDIDSMEIAINDTLKIKISYKGNKVTNIISDSLRLDYKYRLGRVILAGNTKIVRIFPFIFAFNHGLQAIYYKGFGKINNAKLVSGLKTMDKTKMRYIFGKLKRTKIYNWNTVAQNCRYVGLNNFYYPNDSIVIKKYFEKTDSVAVETTYVFDKLGNIKEINDLIKKRYVGWGIDVTYYAYNGNELNNAVFSYVLDNYKNWTTRLKYNNGNLQEKVIRKIYYKNNKP